MKKYAFLAAAATTLLLSSCNVKECRCYQFSNGKWTGPNASYTSPGTACNSLNNNTTQCNEMDDPIIDPNDIAVGKKK